MLDLSLLAAAAAAQKPLVPRVWQFFADGGFCMILLGVCSLVTGAAIVFKLLSLRRELVVPAALARKVAECEAAGRHELPNDLATAIDEGRSTLARLCAVAVRHRGETRTEITEAVQASAREEVLVLHSGMAIIDATISLAPLLGLLGMASGLVVMFGGLGENPDPTLVSRGISEALNTTVFGLGLAVPAIMAHAFFQRRIDRYVASLESTLARFARMCEGTAQRVARRPPVLPSPVLPSH